MLVDSQKNRLIQILTGFEAARRRKLLTSMAA